MRIAVDHLTEYRYERPVGFGEHALYLRPRESQTVHVASFSRDCAPEAKVRWMRDCFNNVVAVASFGVAEASLLSFHCRMAFDVTEENPFDFILEPRAHQFPFSYDDREKSALRPYLEPEESERWKILEWVRSTVGLSAQSRDDEGTQSANETVDLGSGSCRDMAELLVATSRQLGFAARFVSGYLYEPSPPDGTAGFNRAAGSMHAWAEVYLPGAGWRGLDPTNGILTDHRFLPAAVANRPEWVNPIQGRYFHTGQVASAMSVTLKLSGAV
jgi:transglutaminase-like putative cysteine protease